MDSMHVLEGRFPSHFMSVSKRILDHRFFAATELKAMLAHMLINYDIKAETDLRPPELCIAEATMPNPQGKIWIRKRE
jgi:hypothetical protein